MRRIFEWVGGFALIAFSFYFTDRVSLMVANKSELMQEIKSVSSTYESAPVDAIIDDEANSIIPGKYGRVVNNQESYFNMHDFGLFNENYLVFDYVKPKNSLDDNKDKFISSGNPSKRNIALIICDNEEIRKYFEENKISYNIVLNKFSTANPLGEIINAASNKTDFNAITNKTDISKRLCLKGSSNLDLCKKNSYYLIDPKLNFNNTNYIEIKNNLNPGSIISISKSTKLEDVKLLINEIKYKDLSIVHLSKLIDEKDN